jgi:hypothetical protein
MDTPLRALVNSRVDGQHAVSNRLNLVGTPEGNDLRPLRNSRLGDAKGFGRRRNGPEMLNSCFSIHGRDGTAC